MSYRHHIEAHLIPQLLPTRLRDLRRRHLTEAYARIVKQRQAVRSPQVSSSGWSSSGRSLAGRAAVQNRVTASDA